MSEALNGNLIPTGLRLTRTAHPLHRFETKNCAKRFVSTILSALPATASAPRKPTVAALYNEDENDEAEDQGMGIHGVHSEDLLGLFGSSEDSEEGKEHVDPKDDRGRRGSGYCGSTSESTKGGEREGLGSASSSAVPKNGMSLKELLKVARSLSIQTEGMLDRREVENAVNVAKSKGKVASETDPAREEEDKKAKWKRDQDDRKAEAERIRRASKEHWERGANMLDALVWRPRLVCEANHCA